jgi:hypothetical protein
VRAVADAADRDAAVAEVTDFIVSARDALGG